MLEPTSQQLLDLPLPPNTSYPSDVVTVRDYLIRLLFNLWRDASDFNAKRPFGYSCWEHDLYIPMVRAGMVPGTFHEDGYELDDFDYEPADRLILAAILSLATPGDRVAVDQPEED